MYAQVLETYTFPRNRSYNLLGGIILYELIVSEAKYRPGALLEIHLTHRSLLGPLLTS